MTKLDTCNAKLGMKAILRIGYWLKSLAVFQFSGWTGLLSSPKYLDCIWRTHSLIFNVFHRQPGCVIDHSLPSSTKVRYA
jgi:hypothetical protein